ncbi:MAG: hypothetical protein M1819_004966 [Sarea resinae]|nr:MAG: hypothetical protein M1819_004966 [Sarea resinae]
MAQIQNSELRTSLHTLAKLSSTTATRLDDTYYSILESVSSLHSTLLSLHSLSHLTATLHSHFQSQTTSLSQTISHSVRALSSHVPQHTHRIQTLDSRLHKGREKVRLLGDRLEDVREKIATWEKREREWQAKTTRRLRLLWAVMGAVALLMAILWGVHYFGPAGRDGGGGEGGPGAPLAVSENGDALVSGVGGGDVAGKANDSSSFLADVIEAVGGKKKINDGNGGGGRGMKDAAGVPKTAAVSSSPPNDDDDDNNDTPLRLFDEL